MTNKRCEWSVICFVRLAAIVWSKVKNRMLYLIGIFGIHRNSLNKYCFISFVLWLIGINFSHAICQTSATFYECIDVHVHCCRSNLRLRDRESHRIAHVTAVNIVRENWTLWTTPGFRGKFEDFCTCRMWRGSNAWLDYLLVVYDCGHHDEDENKIVFVSFTGVRKGDRKLKMLCFGAQIAHIR